MPPPGPPCPATPPSQPLHPEEATRALRRPRGARPPPSPLARSSAAPPPMAMPLTHPRPRPALRPTILNLPCWCARKRGLTDSRLTGRCGRELPPGQVRAAVTPQTHDFSSKRSICVSSPARVCAPRFARARNASLQTPQKPGRPRSPVSLSVPQSSTPASHARLIGPVFPPHFRFPRETAKLTLQSIRDLAPQHRRQFGSNKPYGNSLQVWTFLTRLQDTFLSRTSAAAARKLIPTRALPSLRILLHPAKANGCLAVHSSHYPACPCDPKTRLDSP